MRTAPDSGLLEIDQFVSLFCALTSKWVVVLRPDLEQVGEIDPWGELIGTAPILESLFDGPGGQIVHDGLGFIVCATEIEAREAYDGIVGDDGPTPHNSYNGPCRIYAVLYGLYEHDGKREYCAINENT